MIMVERIGALQVAVVQSYIRSDQSSKVRRPVSS